jgi:hypothetical protein
MCIQKNRWFVAVSIIAVVASLCAMPLVTLAGETDRIPEVLWPSAGEDLAFVLAADGVQIYNCKPSPKDPYSYTWAFIAPEATLSEAGSIVGRHFAGPTWASGSDLSSVKGTVRERADGGAGNIPWLLLAGASTSTPGKFANVTSVQRLATKGGVEPTQACGASNVGKEVRVPYTADYYFYKRKNSGVRFEDYPYMAAR